MVCDAVAVTRRAETPAESSPSGEPQPAVAAEPVAAADAEVGLSLEELAAQSGVVGRTIRFYQSERLLPKPRRDARDRRRDHDRELNDDLDRAHEAPTGAAGSPDTAPSTWSASD